MTKTPYQTFLSKPEITFWLPIITSSILIAGSFFAVSGRIDLLNLRVEQLISQNQIILQKYTNLEDRYGILSLEVTRMNTIHNLGPIK